MVMLRTDIGNGWFEKVKETLHTDSWPADFDLNAILYSGMYGVYGFVIGYCLKKHGRTIIGLSLVCAFVLLLLFSFNIIIFDLVRLKELFGLTPTTTPQSVLQSFYEWVRNNKMVSISAIVGFVVGYVVG
jgi:uncharacterized membrane protein (Fun14 family)